MNSRLRSSNTFGLNKSLIISSLCLSSVLVSSSLSYAQGPYPILPPGMRVVVGGQGALARNTPDLNGTCGNPPHTCTAADSVLPNTYGVVQPDAAVPDPAGWSWVRVTFESGVTGWVSGYPPFLNMLSPPQMIQGSSFRVVGDYNGPALTSARCINDGVNSNAILALQPNTSGQQGTLQCPWNNAQIGNHITALIAINANGQSPQVEFQFSVTSAPIPPIPVSPMNMRILPVTGGGATTFGAKPPVEPPQGPPKKE